MNQLVPFTDRTPAHVAACGEGASHRFFEFLKAQMRHPNACRVYARAAMREGEEFRAIVL